MFPNFALTICVVFIIIIILNDINTKSKVSLVILLPFIWYAIGATRSVALWMNALGFNVTSDDVLEGNPIDRNVYLILMFLGILILVKRRNRLFEILRGNIWVLLLFIFMGISITWSDFGDVAFKRWIKTTGALVMAFIVLSEREPLEAISTLLRRCFYIHLPLSIVFIKYFRTLGVDYSYHGLEVMWKGVTTHKNVLGQIVMSSGIYYIWNILRKPEDKRILLNTLFLLMTFWLMNGPGYSRSNTSIMVFFIGLLLLVLLNFAKSNIEYIRKYMVLGVFLLGFIYLISQLVIGVFSQGSLLSISVEATGRDLTLTGRTDLWNDILVIASKHPMLGVGYGSFWIGDLANNLWQNHPWKPEQGHNGYIDIYVELGVVGLILLGGVIIAAFKGALRTLEVNFEYGRLRLVYLTMIVFHNITESSFGRGHHNLWLLFLFVVLNIPEKIGGSYAR